MWSCWLLKGMDGWSPGGSKLAVQGLSMLTGTRMALRGKFSIGTAVCLSSAGGGPGGREGRRRPGDEAEGRAGALPPGGLDVPLLRAAVVIRGGFGYGTRPARGRGDGGMPG